MEKCQFHKDTIKFLGYIISPKGIQMDQEKVTAIINWQTPTTLKSLQRFLGFSNFYRKFINHYSTIVQPLTRLTGKQKFVWDSKAEQAFHNLKEKFTTAPILRIPDPDLPYTLEVDASNVGIGAILLQPGKQDNQLHPIAYYS
ncbi:uncharacterized protein LOC128664391 [Bombina bombina]|uniref:uncharacterized protein LOC128664391 n=1 Tax=Bombina bombina TaxID=8345 RepID=UPI00235AA71E|nr:uncharacterized protein LOC128664391 [Bombina bombina]